MVTPGRFSSRANSAQSGSTRRLWPGCDSGAAEQPAFQSVVGDIVRQRPFQPGRRRPLQIVLDRAARHAETSPDLARAHPIVVKPQ